MNFLKDRNCSLLPVALYFPKCGFDGNDCDDDDGDDDDDDDGDDDDGGGGEGDFCICPLILHNAEDKSK